MIGINQLNIATKLEPHGKMPEYSDEEAAGADLFLDLLDEKIDLPMKPLTNGEKYYLYPRMRAVLSVGVRFAIPKGYYGKVFDRSGLASKQGLIAPGGVIDSNYRGVLKVILINTSDHNITLEHHMKIAQIVFHQYQRGEFKQVESLDETSRGENGFGSTGM